MTARPPRRAVRRCALAAVSLGLLSLAACGLPDDSAPRDIPPGFALDTGESSTIAPGTVTGTSPRVYFLGGSAGEPGTLVGRPRDVQPNDLAGQLRALFDGPTAFEQGQGLRTAIPEGTELLEARVLPDGTARINLNDAIFAAADDSLIDAVAQIVFTATRNESGVSSVVLLVDGEVRAWKRGDGSLEKKPLTPLMYPALDPTSEPDYVPFPVGGPAESTPEASTTTSTSVTTTTQPQPSG